MAQGCLSLSFHLILDLNPFFLYNYCMEKMKNYNSFISFGNDFIKSNAPELARKFFNQALEVKPEDPIALDGLAWTYHMEGKNKKARKILERAINLDSNFAEAYTDLGCILHTLGETKEAEKMHKKSLEIDPSRYDAKWNLALLYFQTNRFTDLEVFLENNIDVLTQKNELLQMLGEVKIIKKDFQKAKNIFTQCLEKDEHNVEAGILLSYVEFEMKEK